jgi:hypothetical protein
MALLFSVILSSKSLDLDNFFAELEIIFATYRSIPRYSAKSEMDMVNNSSNINAYLFYYKLL